ncbi:MAG: exosortase/archaeosortase family protein [Candidatus Binatia bacterium]
MARRARSAQPHSAAPTFSGFVIRLALYLFIASLAFSVGGLHLHMRPLQVGMASAVAAAANWFSADAVVEGTIIKTQYAALDINHECTGVFVLLVYAVFVLAYPAPAAQRTAGIAVGATVLMAINLARLVVLTLVASQYPEWFDYFHEYFFQGLFIALLAFLASLWTEQVRRAAVNRVSA